MLANNQSTMKMMMMAYTVRLRNLDRLPLGGVLSAAGMAQHRDLSVRRPTRQMQAVFVRCPLHRVHRGLVLCVLVDAGPIRHATRSGLLTPDHHPFVVAARGEQVTEHGVCPRQLPYGALMPERSERRNLKKNGGQNHQFCD